MRTATESRFNARPLLSLGLLLLLGACGGGGGDSTPTAPTTPTQPTVRLDALYGRLTLNYSFSGSTTVFSDSADFSSANLSSDQTVLAASIVQNPYRAIGCTVNTVAGFNYSYLCVVLDVLYETAELFVFNLAGKSVSNGLYEYCLSGVSIEDCTSDLLQTPDGVVLASSGVLASDRAGALGLKPDIESQASKQSEVAGLKGGDARAPGELRAHPAFAPLQEHLRSLTAQRASEQR